MRVHSGLCLILVGLSTGCGSSSSPGPVDMAASADLLVVGDLALPTRFSCYDNPSTALADPVAIQTKVQDYASAVVSGALVELRHRGSSTVVVSGMSDSMGFATLMLPTGGMQPPAFSIVSTVSMAGFLPTQRIFAGLTPSTNDFARLNTSANLDSFYGAGGGPSRVAGRATLTVQVKDCADTKVSGATISLEPSSGTIEYPLYATSNVSASSTTTDGSAVGLNLTPGTTMVHVQVGDVHLIDFSVDLASDTFTNVITR
jgi:hypothetical protein